MKWKSICAHLRLHIIHDLFWCKYTYHHNELWIHNCVNAHASFRLISFPHGSFRFILGLLNFISFVLCRFESFHLVSFRFVSFRHESFRFVLKLFNFVSFRFSFVRDVSFRFDLLNNVLIFNHFEWTKAY